MEMEDWTYALAIALAAVVWVTIFVDYRKKLMRVMPAVDQVSHRKQEFSNKISEAENSAQEIAMSIDGMRREIEGLEDQDAKSPYSKYPLTMRVLYSWRYSRCALVCG